MYDIKENAHMLYWKSVFHVQSNRSKARIQGKDKNNFGYYMPVYNEYIAFELANWPLETQLLLNRGDL